MYNEIVIHKTLGKGVIINVETKENNTYITVAFDSTTIEFNFPNAFEIFLMAESDELKKKVREALAEKQKKIEEELKRKELEKARIEAQKAQANLELLKKKSPVRKEATGKIVDFEEQIIKGQFCGRTAISIYEQGCKKFDWDWSKKGSFGMLKILYTEIATPEGYSVWMLPHSNKTGENNGKVENRIYSDYAEQWWFDSDHPTAKKRKRLLFYKENNGYYFAGIYLFDGEERVEDINGKICYVERFNLVSKTYPEE